MLRFLKSWLRDLITIAMYPWVIFEMVCCVWNENHVNTLFAHENWVRMYNLSKGNTEVIERLIFGPKRWKESTIVESISSMSRDFWRKGWTSLNLSLKVSELCKELAEVQFSSRLSNNRYSILADLQTISPLARGRWDAEDNKLFSLSSFASIVTSHEIHKLATELLGKYVITSAVVWVSFCCDNEEERIRSAQVFHVDQDFLDDLKLFVNLSDTSFLDGPLEYITGTNNRRSKRIWMSSPISDESVNQYYDPDKHAYFTGPMGKVYLSDNRGIHRDRPPTKKRSKLALQINFSRSQYGSGNKYSSRPKLSKTWPSFNTWHSAITEYPFVYSLLFR